MPAARRASRGTFITCAASIVRFTDRASSGRRKWRPARRFVPTLDSLHLRVDGRQIEWLIAFPPPCWQGDLLTRWKRHWELPVTKEDHAPQLGWEDSSSVGSSEDEKDVDDDMSVELGV